jgi:hypothetical protein
MKGSIDKLFHIADHNMHQRQPDIGLLRWSYLFTVCVLLSDDIQGRKRIGLDRLAGTQVPSEKKPNAVCAHTVHSLHGHKPGSFFSGFNSNKHGPLEVASLVKTAFC